MGKKGIKLSPKHGVNPSLDTCFICGKEYGLVLFGRMKGDAEAPKQICSGGICPDCQKIIDDGGVFILEVKDGTDHNNPYRTGRMVGIRREAANRLFEQEIKTAAYMEETAFEHFFGEYIREQKG